VAIFIPHRLANMPPTGGIRYSAAIRTLDFAPAVANHLGDVLRHRHVVQLLSHLAAVVVGPVEEFQCLTRSVGVLDFLVHQDERRTGDRPAFVTRLVGQHQIHARRGLPVGVGGSSHERFHARRNDFAGLVLQVHQAQVVLGRVSELDITDRAIGVGDLAGDTSVRLGADTGRPRDGLAFTHVVGEIFADLGQVMREQEVGARAFRTVDRRDLGIRQIHVRVQLGDRLVVPAGDLALVDVGQRRAVQVERTPFDTFDVECRDHAAHDHRPLHQAVLVELFLGHRCIAGAEGDRLGDDLLNAATGTDRLIVEADTGFILVGVRPLRIDRVREGCAGAGNGFLGLNTSGTQNQRSGNERCEDVFKHSDILFPP